jgi:hypothetical protein
VHQMRCTQGLECSSANRRSWCTTKLNEVAAHVFFDSLPPRDLEKTPDLHHQCQAAMPHKDYSHSGVTRRQVVLRMHTHRCACLIRSTLPGNDVVRGLGARAVQWSESDVGCTTCRPMLEA